MSDGKCDFKCQAEVRDCKCHVFEMTTEARDDDACGFEGTAEVRSACMCSLERLQVRGARVQL